MTNLSRWDSSCSIVEYFRDLGHGVSVWRDGSDVFLFKFHFDLIPHFQHLQTIQRQTVNILPRRDNGDLQIWLQVRDWVRVRVVKSSLRNRNPVYRISLSAGRQREETSVLGIWMILYSYSNLKVPCIRGKWGVANNETGTGSLLLTPQRSRFIVYLLTSGTSQFYLRDTIEYLTRSRLFLP